MNAEWRDSCPTNKDKILYMYRNNLRTDCGFVVGKEEEKKVFRAHTFVLTLVSAVFETMFNNSVGQDTDNIRIPDVDPDIFHTFLKAIYLEELVPRSFKEACYLLDLASKYMIKGMKDQCLSYMASNITSSNAAAGFQVLSLHGPPDLASACWKLIQKDTTKVLTSKDFTDLGKETLVRILGEDELAVESENELVSAVQRWVDAYLQKQKLTKESDRVALLSEFLPYIRFMSMSAKEFLTFPARTSLFSYTDSDSILNNILDPQSPTSLPPNVCSKKRVFLPKGTCSSPTNLHVAAGPSTRQGMCSSPMNLHVTAGSSTRQVPLPGDWKEQLDSAAERGDVGVLWKLQAGGADLSVREVLWGYTLLHRAAWEGHTECVQWLLEQGLSLHSTAADGWTPLHCAACCGSLETVRLLLEKGADPAAEDNARRTPLHDAAHWGNLETVRLLLESGADPTSRDSDGKTALDDAVSEGRSAVADLLRRRTYERQVFLPWKEQLRWAAKEAGDVGELKRLQAAGADLSVRYGGDMTLLHWAAWGGHAECVQWLLEQGLSLHSTEAGWTPLHCAACYGRLETVQLLLGSGADPAARDSKGRTALDLAISEGHAAVADLLKLHLT